jgi:chromosome segregation ATPase
MDTAQATAATKQRDALQKKLDSLGQQYREAESALSRERTAHESLTAQRTKLLEELPGADDATSGWAHGEIDRLDGALQISSRVMEALQNSLSRLTGEKTTVHGEYIAAQEIVRQETRTRELAAFQTQIEIDRRAAEQALDAARSALFTLNRTLVRGEEIGGGSAESISETFRHQQHNPELLGWQSSGFPLPVNLTFTLRPAFKRAPQS